MSVNNKADAELFWMGDDIETSYGTLRFLTYKEYLKLQWELSIISMNILHFYWLYKKSNNARDAETVASLEAIKSFTLYQFILGSPELLSAYETIYEKVILEKDYLETIFNSEELFIGFRQLIMDMNLLSESPVSPNAEIQEYYDNRKKAQQREAGKQETTDVVSSIVVGSPHSFEEVANMTVIQVNLLLSRIAAFKNFDASTLFKTVSPDYEIASWNTHIDLYSKQELGTAFDNFSKKYSGLFD